MILLLIFSLSWSCKKTDMKIDYSNFKYIDSCFLKNQLTDTLFIQIYYFRLNDGWSEDKIKTMTLLPGETKAVIGTHVINEFIDNSLLIYKTNNYNNVYIKFSRSSLPFNYKLNYFNENDWEKNQYYITEMKNGMRFYTLYNEYSFTISFDNIINLK